MGYLFAAHSAFCIPFAYLPIRARLENMDLTLERAAADLYATPWKAFRQVTFPLLWPGIIAGFMLAFVISLDDVVITEFVKSAGQDTLPTYMLGQLRRVFPRKLTLFRRRFSCCRWLLLHCSFSSTRNAIKLHNTNKGRLDMKLKLAVRRHWRPDAGNGRFRPQPKASSTSSIGATTPAPR